MVGALDQRDYKPANGAAQFTSFNTALKGNVHQPTQNRQKSSAAPLAQVKACFFASLGWRCSGNIDETPTFPDPILPLQVG